MNGFRDSTWYRLTRHFYVALFDFGFLSEAGSMAFTRVVLGVCGVILGMGVLLLRVYFAKYAMLAAQATPELYRLALPADFAMLAGLSMWLVAIATALTAHAVFPDVTDFRVLMPLPVTRLAVFSAKAAAVLLFVSIFTFAMEGALALVFVLIAMNRWADGSMLVGVARFAGVNLLACAFAALAVIAMQGALVALWPRGRPAAASAAWRSLMLCGLIISFPVVARLATAARPLLREEGWLLAVPPVWFAGLERVLGGQETPYLVRHAALATAALLVVLAVVAASYAALYRRFSMGSMQLPMMHASVGMGATWRREPRRPARLAVSSFTRLTLRRSVLHQGIFVVLAALGAGLVANSFLLNHLLQWRPAGAMPSPALMGSVRWAPFALVFAAVCAARAAFNVPIESRANWIFRTVEQPPAQRVDQLEGARGALLWYGVAVPVTALLPVQVLVLGWGAAGPAAIALGLGTVLVEWVMFGSTRLPFTCSYIPGKTFVPTFVLLALLSFVLFAKAGTTLVSVASRGSAAAVAVGVLLVAAIVTLRTLRRRTALGTPLMFEDELPSDINPLVFRH